MIVSFKSKALKKFFLEGDASKVNPTHIKKLRRILLRLNNAHELRDLNVSGWRLHKLKGDLKDFYAVDLSGNFRIIFKFDQGEVQLVDYLDYH
ncbi:MAG: type II toxin-antitoxin system RelE/ParE family toxin [Cyclobacteriaceae bacterium]